MNHKDYWDSRADGSLQNKIDILQEEIKKIKLTMTPDKNIQIGFTVNKKKNTITIKESVLDLFSLKVTHNQKRYKENKTAINKTIKNLIGTGGTEIQGLSGKVSKFLLSCVENEIK